MSDRAIVDVFLAGAEQRALSEYHAIARQGQNIGKKQIAGRPPTRPVALLGESNCCCGVDWRRSRFGAALGNKTPLRIRELLIVKMAFLVKLGELTKFVGEVHTRLKHAPRRGLYPRLARLLLLCPTRQVISLTQQ